jgi:hypothetical protein
MDGCVKRKNAKPKQKENNNKSFISLSLITTYEITRQF